MASTQPPNHNLPRLSCVQCRDRKVSCDKLNPCTNCQRMGVVCEPVQRRRLPRGRNRPRRPAAESLDQSNTDLNGRVAKLEHLLQQLVPQTQPTAAQAGNASADALLPGPWKDQEQSVDQSPSASSSSRSLSSTTQNTSTTTASGDVGHGQTRESRLGRSYLTNILQQVSL